jgi:hypothetical protein
MRHRRCCRKLNEGSLFGGHTNDARQPGCGSGRSAPRLVPGLPAPSRAPTRPREAARYGADLLVIDSGLTPPPPGEASDTGRSGIHDGHRNRDRGAGGVRAEKVPVLSVPGRISLLLDFGLG